MLLVILLNFKLILIMLHDSIYLGGYGIFVWPAFMFALVLCFTLYNSTKKKYLKYEKLFENLKQDQTTFVEIKKTKKIHNKVFSTSKVL